MSTIGDPNDERRGYVSEIFCSFQGEGLFAGHRHVFVRMAGCNLRCVYCDTPDSLERTPTCAVHGDDGSERTLPNPLGAADIARLVEPFLASRSGVRALAITGGEPLLQSQFLATWLADARPPLPILLETNGTYPDRLERLLPYLDVVSMDVKLPSNSGEPEFWERHRAFLRASLGKTVYVKVPVDDRTTDEDVRRAAALVAAEDRTIPFFLQPIVSPDGDPLASPPRLERFYDVAAESLRDVRVLPQAHKALGVR